MIRYSLLAFSCISGALAVMGGAFAAHALDPIVDAQRIGWLKTASEYQLIHSVAMIAIRQSGGARVAGICFALGIVLFCGSLYGLVFTEFKPLGAVAPLGGVSFIAGWMVLAFHAIRPGSSQE